MKLTTALRYAHEISNRVKSVNGLLGTPMCNREAVRISRIWVFGSTVKGSQSPNDLDILIECKAVGGFKTHSQGKLDKWRLRSYGCKTAICAETEAFKWLTKGMKKVSRHDTKYEATELDVKVLIYPRNDLKPLQAL